MRCSPVPTLGRRHRNTEESVGRNPVASIRRYRSLQCALTSMLQSGIRLGLMLHNNMETLNVLTDQATKCFGRQGRISIHRKAVEGRSQCYGQTLTFDPCAHLAINVGPRCWAKGHGSAPAVLIAGRYLQSPKPAWLATTTEYG